MPDPAGQRRPCGGRYQRALRSAGDVHPGPGVWGHGELPQRHHLHRWRSRHPALPGLSHRTTGRAQHLPGGGLPPHLWGSAHALTDGGVRVLAPRAQHGARAPDPVLRRLPLRCPSDVDDGGGGGGHGLLLSRHHEHLQRGRPGHDGAPHPRQDAQYRREMLQASGRPPVRVSRTTRWATSRTS